MTPKKHNISLSTQGEKALKEAVRHVVEDHKNSGDSLAVWRNGKVALIPASKLPRKAS